MSADHVPAAIEQALAAGHFFVAPPHRLRIEHRPGETIRWEVFRGHLLEAAHTSHECRFDAWHVFVDDEQSTAVTSLVSVLWQPDSAHVFVVRQILTYGFEAYEDPPGVIETRPVEKWVRELVGTVDRARLPREELPHDLGIYLMLAVVGTSRLPIKSLESPLPAFSLGQLAYLPSLSGSEETWTDPIAMFRSAVDGGLPVFEQTKALEMALRGSKRDELPALVEVLRQCRDADSADVRAHWLFRELFNHVALSPYTDFCDRLLDTLLALATPGDPVAVTAVADTMSYMLRHLCRHLTAFDLKLFHNFGANYPDALFLDGLLKAYLRILDAHCNLWTEAPDDSQSGMMAKRRRRRALRQACLARKHYEGNRVPDAPTSMGENLRVLPPPFVRVPDEQIMQAAKRRRSLFAGAALDSMLLTMGSDALEASLADLAHTDELTELGLAQFLDRPLGVSKQPGEVDRTPLVSCEAFSRSIARGRLGEMQTAGWLSQDQHLRHVTALETLSLAGVPISELSCAARPGVVSLADAAKAATDFVILRTSRNSLADFVEHYDWAPLAKMTPSLLALLTVERRAIIVHYLSNDAAQTARLAIYDFQGRPRLELGFDMRPGGVVSYVERRGVELVERLHVLRIYEPTVRGQLAERDLSAQAIWLELRTTEGRASVASDHP